MKNILFRSLLITGALCFAAATGAARPVQERRPVKSDALVTIKNINGSVTIAGWSRDEVEITGTLAEDIKGLDISGTASRLTIAVDYPEHMQDFRPAKAELNVKLPVGASVRVEVVNASISISELQGEVELEAVNGDITVEGKPARIDAQSVNGTIEITARCARVQAQTVGGRILLDGVEGDVSASTVSGSIRVPSGKFQRLEFSSVSGDIDFAGELDGRGILESESHSGEVALGLAANVSAEFDISTFSGHVQNDFGLTTSGRRRGPGRKLSFTTGDGDARVRISTFSGDIRLVKK